ncbi:MAG: hypothetical protein JXQ72_08620, partial [Anaerolineae bacterium]|nr:hypothetical protein [Anaerolineae bacterium]
MWLLSDLIQQMFKPVRKWQEARRREQLKQYTDHLLRHTRPIRDFLQQPENAAMKARVLANLTSRKVGEDLIEAMGLDTGYDRNFFECMVNAVQSIRREEGKPYRSFNSLVLGPADPDIDADTGADTPPAPAPGARMDVILVETPRPMLGVIQVVEDLTDLEPSQVRELVHNLPAAVLRNV